MPPGSVPRPGQIAPPSQSGYPAPGGYPAQSGYPAQAGYPVQAPPGQPGSVRPPAGYPGATGPTGYPAAAQAAPPQAVPARPTTAPSYPTAHPTAGSGAAIGAPSPGTAFPSAPAAGTPATGTPAPGLPAPGTPVPTVPGAAATPPAGATAPGGVTAQPGVLAPSEAAARSAAVAAATAAAAPQRLTAAVPSAPPDPPDSPSGTVYSAPVAPAGRRRRGRWLGLLPRLAVGAHVANAPALRLLSPSTSAAGLVLGYDADNTVATARLFQPEPTRMVLVGGLWAARILVFRTLALGATVTVLTARPDAWNGFGRWAAGSDDRVRVAPLDTPFHATSSSLAPALVVQDGNALGGTVRGTLGPWQAQLSVVPQLTAYAFPAIREAGLVAVQRLTMDEVTAATPLLRLNRESAALVSALQDDMLALFDDGGSRYVWTQLTRIEREQFGSPHRTDAAAPTR
ncbi:hypothetical protein GCM10009539_81710 [Cryptosporangium japonicum]|uniref:Uncharacterized protein n=1 Tax=Cryptosporangium japonicum TaxID=80872 RepID=A0ABN0V8U8_9ACTN